MVWSTGVGFAFALVHPPLPEWAASAFKIVGDALIPMMLLSLGVRLLDVRWSDWRIGVVGGFVCPLTGLAMAALLSPLLGLDDAQRGLLILFGCLPPAVLNFMVAEQFRQEPGQGRVDRADRQPDLDRVHPARPRAGAQVSVCREDRAVNLHRLLLARAPRVAIRCASA